MNTAHSLPPIESSYRSGGSVGYYEKPKPAGESSAVHVGPPTPTLFLVSSEKTKNPSWKNKQRRKKQRSAIALIQSSHTLLRRRPNGRSYPSFSSSSSASSSSSSSPPLPPPPPPDSSSNHIAAFPHHATPTEFYDIDNGLKTSLAKRVAQSPIHYSIMRSATLRFGDQYAQQAPSVDYNTVGLGCTG
jgi:hypothetical protein